VAIPALFLNLDVVLALTSIGTLFAFVLVCGGVLVLQTQADKPESKFKVPYINGQFIYPVMVIAAIAIILIKAPSHFTDILTFETFPMILFWIVSLVMAVLAFQKKLSLLPILGMISCFYLMAQESHTNWNRFLLWLIVGLIVYFLYSRQHSKLAPKN
jgi:amino acid transporter